MSAKVRCWATRDRMSTQENGIEMSGKEHSVIDIAPTVSAILQLPAPARATGAPIREAVAALTGVRKVAILAPDALGENGELQNQ